MGRKHLHGAARREISHALSRERFMGMLGEPSQDIVAGNTPPV